ncbi:hypothetical protein BRADI_4g13404v3 [Brachypodium distachyon]|uniref:Uncharacterized protein n=1 Tax=Brachypodium distachyon TaxID=15368 RepID=A0A2K2CMJ2_BRADI|nr:hypothetical protein BRADI_4g13404v3 [Brachypodium distachyon]
MILQLFELKFSGHQFSVEKEKTSCAGSIMPLVSALLRRLISSVLKICKSLLLPPLSLNRCPLLLRRFGDAKLFFPGSRLLLGGLFKRPSIWVKE